MLLPLGRESELASSRSIEAVEHERPRPAERGRRHPLTGPVSAGPAARKEAAKPAKNGLELFAERPLSVTWRLTPPRTKGSHNER
jgi:hypothetical protein